MDCCSCSIRRSCTACARWRRIRTASTDSTSRDSSCRSNCCGGGCRDDRGQTMKALLSLATVTWLLGAAIVRLPIAKPERRAAIPFEERLFWSITIGIAVSLSIVLALAAAHRYSFTRLLVADVLLAAAA